jgi:hypothetical protein
VTTRARRGIAEGDAGPIGTIDTSASSNGRGSPAWSGSWTHVRIDRRSAAYCRVTFDDPAISAASAAELAELVDLIEQDSDLEVVLFDSPTPDFPPDLFVRLSRVSVVSVAMTGGRHGAKTLIDEALESVAARLVDSGRHEL